MDDLVKDPNACQEVAGTCIYMCMLHFMILDKCLVSWRARVTNRRAIAASFCPCSMWGWCDA